MAKRKKKRASGIRALLPGSYFAWLMLCVALILIIVGTAIYIKKYAPTKDRMELSEFYLTTVEDEAVVIKNGEVCETGEEESFGNALDKNGVAYIRLNFLKSNLDNGYVYDSTEKTLRYTTDQDIYNVNLGDTFYSVGRESTDLGAPIILEQNGSVYLAMDFVTCLTDVGYSLAQGEPSRLILEGVGYEKKISSVKKETQLRQFGGPKSRVLADVVGGDRVSVMENYGKWSKVMTQDGIIGCIRNKYLSETTSETRQAVLPERVYRHITHDGSICMGWHQLFDTDSLPSLERVLEQSEGLNVISPTWFYLNDNAGGLMSYANMDYVTFCHNRGLEVWALCNDIENRDVSTTTVLNTTSARDNLINNLVSKAVAYDFDGINIDFEYVEPEAADGFIEFIKELSLKCENNDLVLSVDNYVPSEYRAYYNYSEQAKYADYVIIMGYDEHYGGDDEAGSTASIPFVAKAVSDMLGYVDADQIILGMPFYTRVWVTEGDTLTSSTLRMNETYEYLEEHGAAASWSEEEGQNYAAFAEDGKNYQVWVEDADSLSKKLNIMKENHLAGGSFWKLSLEPQSIWSVIQQYMSDGD